MLTLCTACSVSRFAECAIQIVPVIKIARTIAPVMMDINNLCFPSSIDTSMVKVLNHLHYSRLLRKCGRELTSEVILNADHSFVLIDTEWAAEVTVTA